VLRLWNAVLDLIYPPACCHCGGQCEGNDFCRECLARIRLVRRPCCNRCGLPFATQGGENHACGRCLARPPFFGKARAAAIYAASDPPDQPLKSVLQRYKYNRDVSLAAPLARLLNRNLPVDLAAYDLILPVPLHPTRLRWRGFNQALLLARHIAAHRNARVDPFALERVRPTQPQVDLDEQQRQRNVARAFRVTRPELLRGRRVLLVDDVYTTGSTVNECSRSIAGAGADGVDVLVLARAVLA
jgi:ComF family protein